MGEPSAMQGGAECDAFQSGKNTVGGRSRKEDEMDFHAPAKSVQASDCVIKGS